MRHAARSRRRLLIALLACGAALPACSERPEGRNILVITLDTTRADHLSCYGYPPPTTPHIDALAARGVLWEQAYAPMPETLPSHATLFTGQAPRHHGALENHYVLPAEVQTLAELLADRGYQTAAAIGALVLDDTTGIAQGFTTFDLPHGGADDDTHPVERRADAVTDAALAWALGRCDPDQPFLLWAHYYDAHAPYDAPEKTVPAALVQAEVQARAPAFEEVVAERKVVNRLWWDYDNEIAFVDAQVNRLLAGLSKRGLLQNTVIAIVGDHGEGLLQHREKGHGVLLFEEALKVPLLLVAPDDELAGTRVERPVALCDLLPSLLTFAGLPPSGSRLDGADLIAELRGVPAPRETPIFVERPHYSREWLARRDTRRQDLAWGIVAGVRIGRDKLIRDTDGSLQLFDLQADPLELRNVADSAPELAARLSRVLDDWEAASPVPDPGTNALSSDERDEALKQLGY